MVNKNVTTNIYRIQAVQLFKNSIMFGYFCIGFIAFMLKNKSFIVCTNPFYPRDQRMIKKFILWIDF